MQRNKVTITQATWRDFNAFLSLEKRCFGEDAWSWLDVMAALNYPDTVRLKAIYGSATAGFIVGDRRRHNIVGWIATLAVEPQFRRLGIGSRLLEACEQELAMPQVRLTLRVSNEGARKLYEASGYKKIDVWHRYYASGEDGLVMEKYFD